MILLNRDFISKLKRQIEHLLAKLVILEQKPKQIITKFNNVEKKTLYLHYITNQTKKNTYK